MSNNLIPVGLIILQSGNNYPDNFLLCDGKSLKQSDYPDLFNIIGITFGSGDVSDTFNLPNLQDNVVLGSSSSNAISKQVSDPNINIVSDNIPLFSYEFYTKLLYIILLVFGGGGASGQPDTL